jgi:hypothetical protein
MVEYDEDKMQKALVTLAIEEALIEFDNASYEIVTTKLLSDFGCYISDCYKNPEYLKKTLFDLYGDSYIEVVELIKQHLAEYATRKDIAKFLGHLFCDKYPAKSN